MSEINSIQITFVGNPNVGKTTIVNIIKTGEKQDNTQPTLRDFDPYIKDEVIDGNKIQATLNDCSGQESYHNVTKSYLRKTEGFAVVYDVTDKETFEDVIKWVEKIREIHDKDFPILMIGNKIDKEENRVITKDKGERRACGLGIEHQESTYLLHL